MLVPFALPVSCADWRSIWWKRSRGTRDDFPSGTNRRDALFPEDIQNAGGGDLIQDQLSIKYLRDTAWCAWLHIEFSPSGLHACQFILRADAFCRVLQDASDHQHQAKDGIPSDDAIRLPLDGLQARTRSVNKRPSAAG